MHIPFVDLKTQYESLKPEMDQAILAVCGRGDYVLGQAVTDFESAFAQYCHAAHAVGVASGLDALILALKAFDIGPGHEVITAVNSFVATSLAIEAVGARPVFVDCDPKTYTMDPAKVEAVITSKTRALMPVHLYGQSADMDPLAALARKHGLKLIEDAAQAHGGEYKGRRCGILGDAGCFSFYPGKNLGAYGDGGAIVTQDDKVAEKIRLLRNYGSKVKYFHQVKGVNSRLDTIQAAVLNVKLPRLDSWNQSRAKSAALYEEKLKGLPVKLPVVAPYASSIFHLYVIQVEERDRVLKELQAAGVQAGIHYPVPLHLMECHQDLGYKARDFPIAEAAAAKILSLPMFPELTSTQIDYVADQLAKALRVHRAVRT